LNGNAENFDHHTINSGFIYRPIRLYEKDGRRMVYDYNRNIFRNQRDSTTAISPEETGLSRFFIDYHSHSEQLVDALNNWARKVQFTSCKYEEGIFSIDYQQPLESMNKGFMRYMKKHLEKETKYGILTSVSEIETSHRELCKKIDDIMISDAPISIKPSFQKIIFSKIEHTCPTLRRSRDTSLTENNIYLPVFVFKELFDTVYAGESTMDLSIKMKNDNISQLWYGNGRRALGQGDNAVIKKLSEGIKELVQDNEVKKRVVEYSEVHNQLINHEKINELRNKVEELWTYIHGGGYLGGLDACELCDPKPPNHVW
jgi:hypothetical protein